MLRRRGKKEATFLVFGDLIVFSLALWVSLFLRYGNWPDRNLLYQHLGPFALIFLIWITVFFIVDLYERRSTLFQSQLANTIVNAQVINSLIAVAVFYYLLPIFDITPRVTLFLDLVISLIFIFIWRLFVSRFVNHRRPEKYLFLCSGEEVEILKKEFKRHNNYSIEVTEAENDPSITTVVVSYYGKTSAHDKDLYRLIFAGIRIVGIHELYEEVFGRVPIEVINERWFLENIQNEESLFYRALKRLVDLVIATILFVISLPVYPIVYLFSKLTDRGPLFFYDDRLGRNGRVIHLIKFRSMSLEKNLSDRHVTRLGSFLRKTRLDELPQLISVIRGDLSLIGPRPERPDYVRVYSDKIPYYQARHLIQPGLSGWAQILQDRHPHFQVELELTRLKLSYDLYYVRHRGFWLDLKIALKTIKTLLSSQGI